MNWTTKSILSTWDSPDGKVHIYTITDGEKEKKISTKSNQSKSRSK